MNNEKTIEQLGRMKFVFWFLAVFMLIVTSVDLWITLQNKPATWQQTAVDDLKQIKAQLVVMEEQILDNTRLIKNE